MNIPQTFQTKRLLLRPKKMADAKNIFSYSSDLETVRFLSFKKVDTLEATKSFLRRSLNQKTNPDEISYAICLKKSHEFIGAISMREISGFKPNFGYVLMKPYWGHGYMSEALKILVEWALAQPSMFRAWAFCDIQNLASARVLEKAGMKKEGILKKWHIAPNISNAPRDCFVYAKSK